MPQEDEAVGDKDADNLPRKGEARLADGHEDVVLEELVQPAVELPPNLEFLFSSPFFDSHGRPSTATFTRRSSRSIGKLPPIGESLIRFG